MPRRPFPGPSDTSPGPPHSDGAASAAAEGKARGLGRRGRAGARRSGPCSCFRMRPGRAASAAAKGDAAAPSLDDRADRAAAAVGAADAASLPGDRAAGAAAKGQPDCGLGAGRPALASAAALCSQAPAGAPHGSRVTNCKRSKTLEATATCMCEVAHQLVDARRDAWAPPQRPAPGRLLHTYACHADEASFTPTQGCAQGMGANALCMALDTGRV